MWHTSLGDRVLRGAEGRLFQKGLASLLEWTDERLEDHRTGVEVFDHLTVPEKLASLMHVAEAMLLEDVPMCELTAVSEGTVAAIYAHVVGEIQEEITDGSTALRKLILRAADETELLYDDSPDLTCNDVEEWATVVDSLTGNIFWDLDWAVPLVKPDDSPDLANHLRDELGILPDYYVSVPPDPAPVQIPQIRQRIKTLCRMKLA